MKKPAVREAKLTEFTPDDKNANDGTERGLRMLDDSLTEFGAGRSIVVDKNDRIIGGNKTQERAIDIGLEDAIVIETTGDKVIVHKRLDIDLDTERGRQMAIADNRVGEVDLRWNPENLKGIDTSKYFRDDEMEAIKRANQEAFSPNTAPVIGNAEVTDQDISKTQGSLNTQFVNNPDCVKITCPHCGEDFYIAQKDVK